MNTMNITAETIAQLRAEAAAAAETAAPFTAVQADDETYAAFEERRWVTENPAQSAYVRATSKGFPELAQAMHDTKAAHDEQGTEESRAAFSAAVEARRVAVDEAERELALAAGLDTAAEILAAQDADCRHRATLETIAKAETKAELAVAAYTAAADAPAGSAARATYAAAGNLALKDAAQFAAFAKLYAKKAHGADSYAAMAAPVWTASYALSLATAQAHEAAAAFLDEDGVKYHGNHIKASMLYAEAAYGAARISDAKPEALRGQARYLANLIRRVETDSWDAELSVKRWQERRQG